MMWDELLSMTLWTRLSEDRVSLSRSSSGLVVGTKLGTISCEAPMAAAGQGCASTSYCGSVFVRADSIHVEHQLKVPDCFRIRQRARAVDRN